MQIYYVFTVVYSPCYYKSMLLYVQLNDLCIVGSYVQIYYVFAVVYIVHVTTGPCYCR